MVDLKSGLHGRRVLEQAPLFARMDENSRHEPSRSTAQGSGKAEGMQGVAFLHRESRPNTKPNRTQRPR